MGTARGVVGLIGAAVFVLCFMPTPLAGGTWAHIWSDLKHLVPFT